MNPNDLNQNNDTCDLRGKIIVFVPGLGADHRLFKYQTEYFLGSVAVDWIDPISGEALEDYAVRMAAMIRSKLPEGTETNNVIICGLSLGGMIAPYIARSLGAGGYILLCSIQKPSQFPKRYYFDWLIMRNSVQLRTWRISFLGYILRAILFLCGIAKFFVMPEPFKQFLSMPSRKFAELSRMMFDWAYRKREQDNLCNDNLNMPSIHIHGKRDILLPIKLTNPDVIIKDGGHLLALTHPKQVNESIKNFIANLK
ncbi:MAG: alpha/beta hydrolase [Planctomycetaceae bacterium]|jgi:pimeloyl-ACP methyl ester carboxylesterase|nr:alpha/beta hydrolase [Planctomycetaceae bacterium]